MPNYRVVLTFEGTAYHGWQVQPGWPTVQGEMEKAVAQTTAQRVRVVGCGRTDSGVHAEEYVANFKVDSKLPPERMMAAINSRLPEDIVVTACDIAPDDFHATHSVRSKTYRYTLVVGGPRPVMDRNFVYHIHHEVDVDTMRRAAECLVGEHDFAAFVTEHSVERNTVRTVHRLEIDRRGRYVTFTVEGNGFLYNMVRTMVGCLVAVGRGLRPVEWMKEVLDSRDRSKALATAKAQGLTMVKTNY